MAEKASGGHERMPRRLRGLESKRRRLALRKKYGLDEDDVPDNLLSDDSLSSYEKASGGHERMPRRLKGLESKRRRLRKKYGLDEDDVPDDTDNLRSDERLSYEKASGGHETMPRRFRGLESKRRQLALRKQYGLDEDDVSDETDDLLNDESLAYGFDVNAFSFPFKRVKSTWGDDYEIALYGRLGLHCHNLQKGTNFKFVRWEKYCSVYTAYDNNFITLEAKDQASDSVLSLQTLLSDASYVQGSVWWTTLVCRLKCGNKGVDDKWDDTAVADFYKGAMPKWSSVEDLASENKNYYVVQESELQENDWLHLFTEIAFYAFKKSLLRASPPVEIEKVVVVTEEDTADAREKLKAKNAIFYISYKCKDEDHKATIRRTMDDKPEHMRLEVASDLTAEEIQADIPFWLC